MALRARLTPPAPPSQEDSCWHKQKWHSVSSSQLMTGSRRLEAEVYLSEGYRVRQALKGLSPSLSLGDLAEIWQPNRLKGIVVPPGNGTPFLTATQVFDIFPKPRKWISAEKTPGVDGRFLGPGQIVVTCSGAVGRTTLGTDAHKGIIVSHDLLRVDPKDAEAQGWVYACLRSQKIRSVMTSTHYGHIIKHLEVEHLKNLPVPEVNSKTRRKLNEKFDRLLKLRNEAHQSINRAYKRFEDAMGGALNVDKDRMELGFSVSSSGFLSGRRRLEGAFHTPYAQLIEKRKKDYAQKTQRLKDLCLGVWWLPRFKRSFGTGGAGVPYMSADELFTVNPSLNKNILVDPSDDHDQYYVENDWILMACSGQTYGMLGSSTLTSHWHKQFFFSHDLIRIIPNNDAVRSGYLQTTLSHPTLGRPALLREAYGTSIPHLEPSDIANFSVPRFSEAIEGKIADEAERAKQVLSEANELDQEIAADADLVIDDLLGIREGEQESDGGMEPAG